jgi:hypothetical protein
MHTKSWLYQLLVPLVAVFALVIPAGATAAPPTEASGDFAATSTTINGVRFAGPNAIIDLTYTVSYTGTLVGTSVVEGTLIAHGSDAGNFHGTETFTGTVNGVPGTLTFNLVSHTYPTNAQRGKATIVGATGEIAGTAPGPPGPFGSYSGHVG